MRNVHNNLTSPKKTSILHFSEAESGKIFAFLLDKWLIQNIDVCVSVYSTNLTILGDEKEDFVEMDFGTRQYTQEIILYHRHLSSLRSGTLASQHISTSISTLLHRSSELISQLLASSLGPSAIHS